MIDVDAFRMATDQKAYIDEVRKEWISGDCSRFVLYDKAFGMGWAAGFDAGWTTAYNGEKLKKEAKELEERVKDEKGEV